MQRSLKMASTGDVSPPSKRRKLEKARKPLSFTVPEAGLKEIQAKASALGSATCSHVDSITALLEKALTDLRVLHKRVPCSKQEQSLFLTAVENTWIHGRQKRREALRHLRELPRAPHCPRTSSQTTLATAAPPQNQSVPVQLGNQDDSTPDKTTSAEGPTGAQQQPKEQTDNGGPSHEPSGGQKEVSESEDVDMESSMSTEADQESKPKEAPSEASELPLKRPLSPGAAEDFLFKCLLNVIPEEGDVVIEMHWVEGQNKDLMNQLCTFLKNTLLKSITKP